MGGPFWSVYVPGGAKAEESARLQLEQIDIARRAIARYPERFQLSLDDRDIGNALARRRSVVDHQKTRTLSDVQRQSRTPSARSAPSWSSRIIRRPLQRTR